MSEQHKLTAAFNLQAYYCRDLGSPFMGEICDIFAEYLTPNTEVGKLLFDWSGDVTAGGASLPLRLMGCLHRLVISGECPELASVYPPHKVSTNDWPVFERALTEHKEAILTQLQYAPQTNEVRRSAILLPGFLSLAKKTHALPIVMSELGASAGLNMHWDKFHYRFGDDVWGDPQYAIHLVPEWRGSPLEMIKLNVVDRAGCDLNPIDLDDNRAVETLLSYLWADQPERMERTRAAINIFNHYKTRIHKAVAIEWLKMRLAQRYENRVHVIYHTIARQYFSDADKRESAALIETAGLGATKSAPLAWLRFEADGEQPGAALTLRLWQGDQDDGKLQMLGRADYHGRWIDWTG